ncbi:MAG: hypothetical protein SH808_01995, partial [Saprospiraceae bacterium]|nr:hypothetical protein [Saprospiraceae bacterium]
SLSLSKGKGGGGRSDLRPLPFDRLRDPVEFYFILIRQAQGPANQLSIINFSFPLYGFATRGISAALRFSFFI